MKHIFKVLVAALLSSSLLSIPIYAKDIPENYKNLSSSKFEERKAPHPYEAGEIFTSISANGKIYFLVDENGYGRLCTKKRG